MSKIIEKERPGGHVRMKAVRKATMKRSDSYYMKNCPNCSEVWGIIGMCKKQSPVVSLNHMTFWRYIYWSIRTRLSS